MSITDEEIIVFIYRRIYAGQVQIKGTQKKLRYKMIQIAQNEVIFMYYKRLVIDVICVI